MTAVWIAVALAPALFVWAVLLFNGLVRKRNRVKNAWSDLDAQLKRRYDLVPNLVEAVRGYRDHEAGLLERVSEARAGAMKAQALNPAERAPAERALSGAVRSFFAVVEQYPDLKASKNFLSLQDELTRLEEDIASARRYYNASVRELNNGVQTFPANLLAGAMGFQSADFFGAEDGERDAVKVSL